jgi:hypothetical protein
MMKSFRSRRRGVAAMLVLGWALSSAASSSAGAATFPLRLDAQGTPPPSQSAGTTSKTARVSASTAPVQEGFASIRGVLFREDEITRIKGSMVAAINTRTGQRYLSNYTGDNGAYEVKDLPAGTYDIAIELAGKVYTTESLIDLAEKQRLYMSFSLQPKGGGAPGAASGTSSGAATGASAGAAAESGAAAGSGAAGESGTAKVTYADPNSVPAPEEQPAKKKGFWHSAGGITIITVLVGGAFGAAVSSQHN